VIENGTLAVDGKHAVFLSADRIACLDRADGKKIWETDPIKVAPSYSVKVTPVLVLYDGVVLFADSSLAVVNRLWSVNKPDILTAFSAETGEKLWDAPHPLSGYMSPEDVLVLNGVVWVGATLSGYEKGNFKGYNVKTGKLVGDFDPDVESYWFHHRCHRGKATEKYLMMSRVGIEYVDPVKETWDLNHWVRGACLYGVIPANGLTYAPQHPCACYLESKLSGFNALAAGKRQAPDESVLADRLLNGKAYSYEFPDAGASGDDWPTFRGDNARRGCARTPLPPDLERAWTAKIGGRLSTSAVAAGRVYLASIDNHTVHALDASSGKKLWRFTAGGRVDSPPTFWKGRVLFGSADGYVYCLKADDGQLVWRFRAAPIDQRVMSFEQLESVWPVHGSVLVQNDVAWCVAGRSIFLDGGLRLLRLDPATGGLLSETVLDETDRETGKKVQDFGGQLNMPTALPDILSCDGKHVYMHSQAFSLDGRRLPLEQWTYGKPKPDQFSSPVNQDKAFAHIFSPTGFLDDTWWHRTYWLYGSRFIGGWAGYYQAGKRAPAGRILVMEDEWVYGFGRRPQFYRWTTPIEHHLFAVSKEKPPARVEPPTGRRGGGFAVVHQWTRDLPLFARAMLLSGNTLYLAGPADNIDEVAVFKNARQFGNELAEQAEAFDGKRGGLLWIVDAETGEKRKELKLDTVPVFDGMSAAGKRLFMSMKDGSLSCYRSPLPLRPKP